MTKGQPRLDNYYFASVFLQIQNGISYIGLIHQKKFPDLGRAIMKKMCVERVEQLNKPVVMVVDFFI